jgi:hypothetical protein
MTEPERNLFLVDRLSGEVNNGGFHQYFANSSGDCAVQTLGAARAMDADLLRLFQRALSKFPDSKPSEDRATRNLQMERIPDEFHAWSTMDEEFYKLPIWTTEARYIRANQDAFDGPPQPANVK